MTDPRLDLTPEDLTIDDLLDLDPLFLNDQQIEKVVHYFRKKRTAWEVASKSDATTGKRTATKAAKIDAKLKLDQLDLDLDDFQL